jgi:hypothetical protein
MAHSARYVNSLGRPVLGRDLGGQIFSGRQRRSSKAYCGPRGGKLCVYLHVRFGLHYLVTSFHLKPNTLPLHCYTVFFPRIMLIVLPIIGSLALNLPSCFPIGDITVDHWNDVSLKFEGEVGYDLLSYGFPCWRSFPAYIDARTSVM